MPLYQLQFPNELKFGGKVTAPFPLKSDRLHIFPSAAQNPQNHVVYWNNLSNSFTISSPEALKRLAKTHNRSNFIHRYHRQLQKCGFKLIGTNNNIQVEHKVISQLSGQNGWIEVWVQAKKEEFLKSPLPLTKIYNILQKKETQENIESEGISWNEKGDKIGILRNSEYPEIKSLKLALIRFRFNRFQAKYHLFFSHYLINRQASLSAWIAVKEESDLRFHTYYKTKAQQSKPKSQIQKNQFQQMFDEPVNRTINIGQFNQIKSLVEKKVDLLRQQIKSLPLKQPQLKPFIKTCNRIMHSFEFIQRKDMKRKIRGIKNSRRKIKKKTINKLCYEQKEQIVMPDDSEIAQQNQ